MARINIENIGGVVDSRFRKARILKLYPKDDTADIELVDTGEKYLKVPIFYHCEPEAKQRENGALEGAAAAFEEDDIVYVKFKKEGEKLQQPVIIAGEELRSCTTWNIILFYRDEADTIKAALYSLKRDKLEKDLDVEALRERGFSGDWDYLFSALQEPVENVFSAVFHDLTLPEDEDPDFVSVLNVAYARRNELVIICGFLYHPRKKALKWYHLTDSLKVEGRSLFDFLVSFSEDLHEFYVYERRAFSITSVSFGVKERAVFFSFDKETGSLPYLYSKVRYYPPTRYASYFHEVGFGNDNVTLSSSLRFTKYQAALDRNGVLWRVGEADSFGSSIWSQDLKADWGECSELFSCSKEIKSEEAVVLHFDLRKVELKKYPVVKTSSEELSFFSESLK
jgi:hypothetical protein